MRENGKTHREISKILGVSVGRACDWVRHVHISPEQKQAIFDRRTKHVFTPEERIVVLERLKKAREESKYTAEELLEKIRSFHTKHGRIPLKREFNSLRVYRQHFGSWNAAIIKAGFTPNPVLSAKKFTASDGHQCDSFTEKVIDDWLYAHGIGHRRMIPYGSTKYTADFGLADDVVLEFFGLARVQAVYDAAISKKRALARKFGWHMVEAYPEDIYPNKLPLLLGTAHDFEWGRRIRV